MKISKENLPNGLASKIRVLHCKDVDKAKFLYEGEDGQGYVVLRFSTVNKARMFLKELLGY